MTLTTKAEQGGFAMKKGILVVLSIAFVLFIFGSALAEEKFGVKVYDGAKYDAATSKALKESMSLNAHCYRTSDTASKVIEFYKKQPGLKLMGPATKEGALFQRCKEVLNEYTKTKIPQCDLDITIQNPWMDMKTGKMNKDTLISIVKRGE